MWRRPWGFREGFIVGAGLVLTGVLLQLAVGRIHWEFMAFPVNAAVGLSLSRSNSCCPLSRGSDLSIPLVRRWGVGYGIA